MLRNLLASIRLLVTTGLTGLLGCGPGRSADVEAGTRPGAADRFAALRRRMVEEQIEARGIKDERLLAALRSVPRHEFMDPADARYAYGDHAAPIDCGQTISQPYIVALMTHELGPQVHARAGARVLEVGTGSGYQAAVLAAMGIEVFTIEIVPELATKAQATLARLGYGERVHARTGDGYRGWPDAAPFDGILVTAAPDHVPEPLYEQLAVGGRLVIPVGETLQDLLVVEKTTAGRRERNVAAVRFVPMRGEAETKGR